METLIDFLLKPFYIKELYTKLRCFFGYHNYQVILKYWCDKVQGTQCWDCRRWK